jgi:hypothetical protein
VPYSIDYKNKCIYKKKSDGSRGEKVGCTKGNIKDYIAAVQIHAESKTTKMKLKKKSLREMLDNPEQIKPIAGALSQIYAVQKPYSGCELTSLVKPIDPLLGIGAGHSIVPDEIHAVFADEDLANDIANDLFEKHMKAESALEEKKEATTKKVKSALDMLESKRKEHMDMVKEDPKNASKHRDQIAIVTEKIDDLMTKLEKIEKSKKQIVKEDDKKKKTKK